ncbi:hypothetical protein [Spirillospora sp. NPDC029432]|uniref:hypothetical protein n=1 Tax=Spirillospora sp. NPDC029432 TaxID=3154599 RepID=UPI003454304F
MDPDRPSSASPSEGRPLHELTAGFGIGPGRRPGMRDAAGTAGTARRRPAGSRGHRLLLTAVVPGAAGLALGLAISLGWAAPAAAAAGGFADHYCGVFALVALSLSVMIGLLAAGRTVLPPGARVRAQAVHRAAAFTAVAMLAVHLASQLLRHRVGPAGAFLPAGAGPIAFYLLAVATASGIARGRFAPVRHPWTWRALHLTAYAAWPLAVLHGLTAGRTPPAPVRAAYLACLAAVALALAVRLARRAGRARRRERPA